MNVKIPRRGWDPEKWTRNQFFDPRNLDDVGFVFCGYSIKQARKLGIKTQKVIVSRALGFIEWWNIKETTFLVISKKTSDHQKVQIRWNIIIIRWRKIYAMKSLEKHKKIVVKYLTRWKSKKLCTQMMNEAKSNERMKFFVLTIYDEDGMKIKWKNQKLWMKQVIFKIYSNGNPSFHFYKNLFISFFYLPSFFLCQCHTVTVELRLSSLRRFHSFSRTEECKT